MGLVAELPLRVAPPLVDVHLAVLFVITLPLLEPFLNDTIIGTLGDGSEPETALTAVGAAGATAGTIEFDGPEAGPLPTPFVAATTQVYVLPRVTPLTMIGLAEPLADPVVPPLPDVHVAV